MPRKSRSRSSEFRWGSPGEFVEFLKETLIPDLEEAGYEATAEDFEQCVTLIEYGDYDEMFVRFLQETLIPDLVDTGRHEIAGDFRTCVRYIKQNRKRAR